MTMLSEDDVDLEGCPTRRSRWRGTSGSIWRRPPTMPIRRTRTAPSSCEEILLDLNKLAEGHKYLGVGAFNVSDDGNLLAYSIDTTGYRQYTLRLKDLRTGQTLSDSIERVGAVVWATDNKTLFVSTEDAVSKRSDKFWRHVVGSDKNELLYEEKDELFDVFAGRSLDKKMIFLVSYAKTSREARYLPADNPAGSLTLVLPRQPGHEYDIDHLKYSPYDNVKAQPYPAMLVQISLNDSQVPYWEGAKLAAKLRAMKTDSNPLLVKANLGAGHGGPSGRYDALRETAFTYAFILWQMGLTGGAAGSL